MDTVTRRRFLVASGVAGAGALAAGAAVVGAGDLAARAATDPADPDAGVLVLVTLYGGNDGLNTVVPAADAAYQDARRDLAYEPDELHDLGDGLGLNPAMKGLAGQWAKRRLAVVRGVGYPHPDLSHFRSMDIWQTGSPTSPTASGWLGRWLDATGDDPVRAVTIGSVPAPAGVGTRCTAAALDATGQRRLPQQLAAAVTGLGTAAPGESPTRAAVRTSYRNERTVEATVAHALGAASPQPGGGRRRKGAKGNPLETQLDVVAACVKAGVPTRAYLTSLGGFDTHSGEKRMQEQLLSVVDEAVSGFVDAMAADPRGRRVVVLVHSEFGRRVAGNASEGTDHGTAAPVLLAGVPVKGGFHGEQPSLTDLDDGNLKATVDFRAVYGEIVHSVLGTDPHRVLDTVPAELGLLA
ncbi:DUF1501 domain-containing protein [Jatrophihabitans fulvus]